MRLRSIILATLICASQAVAFVMPPANAWIVTSTTGGGVGSGGGSPPSAVEYIGAETLYTSSANGNFGITVPSDATGIIVAVTGHASVSDNYLLANLNFDNGADYDFTQLVHNGWGSTTSDPQVAVHYMTSADGDWPGTGSKTLYYTTFALYNEGFNIFVFYVKGIDTAAPVRSSQSANGNVSTLWTSSLSGVTTGDLGFVVSYDYTSCDANPTGAGQTAIVESGVFNYAAICVGYEANEGALQVEPAGGSNSVPVAFALKP